jgi:hypothetical protein
MSLKHFQHSWLSLIAHTESPAGPARGELLSQTLGLEAAEADSLTAVPPDFVQTQTQRQAEARRALLENTLPESVQYVLGASHTAAVLEALLARDLPVFSRQALRSAVLGEVLHYLNTTGFIVPHLRDLVHYELAAAPLCFFRLPASRPVSPLRLAPWARLIRLGVHFPLFLRQFRHQPVSLSETPRQEFLLLRDFQGLKLESLTPLQLACLQRCQTPTDGAEFVMNVTYQGAQSEMAAVFRHYVQRGILLP